MTGAETSTDLPVIIVGAGPVGATLAILLAQAGVRVLLLERQSDFAREFRGEVVLPSGNHALDEMGLADIVGSVPCRRTEFVKFYMDRKPIFEGRLDPDVLGGEVFALSQSEFLERLVEEAGRYPLFEFRRGARVMQVLKEDGRACGVRVREKEGESRILGRLVIGTDGRASVVRRDSGVGVHRDRVLLDVVWCKFPPLADTDEPSFDGSWVRAYAGGGHLLLAYITYDGNIQVGWIILKGTYGSLRDRGMEEWIDAMANHVSPELGAHFKRHAGRITQPFLLDAASDCVQSWSAPGLLLLGDAAHTMSPVGAQGINVGLRDSLVAANHLVPALRSGNDADIEAACRAVESERRDEIRSVQRLQGLPPRVVLSTAWWARWIRRMVPRLVDRPWVQQAALHRARIFFEGTGPIHRVDHGPPTGD